MEVLEKSGLRARKSKLSFASSSHSNDDITYITSVHCGSMNTSTICTLYSDIAYNVLLKSILYNYTYDVFKKLSILCFLICYSLENLHGCIASVLICSSVLQITVGLWPFSNQLTFG